MCTCNQCSHICTSPPRARRVHSVTHYVVVEIVTPARGGTAGRREMNDRLTDTRPQSCPVSGQSSDMVERVPECWESPRFRLPSGSLRSNSLGLSSWVAPVCSAITCGQVDRGADEWIIFAALDHESHTTSQHHRAHTVCTADARGSRFKMINGSIT